ncbi:aromatic ring-opening dioxygenase catalytic subunit LigB (macronuclear) [Tetrahymena thermophila SB210]|uniref:Aromatic ring-opening dioxygenase catalytic subunit LigB n=1 Tax=Tetrahymena thermophila (strain SB210) TaxID=312017 RepID=I7M7M8_TETTS|nr:aromatic ring-opening dioxygenase catalytic subunit LigB [Tetrahymena thermophila SB210]EAR94932.1 aromatic ring-opening dioxygenase catalytic subunit LigB [Tetrahymena thermophila SB210]|eukprot:XP_001015177.1 aromatic ring-opening dioxygenase catalytic subunit LigB [Tetrahymena thermophila SB210]
MESKTSRLPSLFISHGDVGQTLNPETQLYKCLDKYAKDNKLRSRIKTAIIISGHWEEKQVTINLNPHPKLVHDHPGRWLYKYNFSLDTNVELAKQIHQKLLDNKIQAKTTTSEDIDHGGWGGLFCLYDIGEQQKAFQSNTKYAPQIVQVSLHSGMDTAFHYKIGQILEQFRDENTIIINSGQSTHSFTYWHHPQFTEWSKEWEKCLLQIITDKDEKKRKDAIIAIKQHKLYNYMHHSDDHFMPLLVSLGTSQYPGNLICLEQQHTFMSSCYQFL